MLVEGKPRTLFFLQTLYLRHLSWRLKNLNIRAWRTWSWVSSELENVKWLLQPWSWTYHFMQSVCFKLYYSFVSVKSVLWQATAWQSRSIPLGILSVGQKAICSKAFVLTPAEFAILSRCSGYNLTFPGILPWSQLQNLYRTFWYLIYLVSIKQGQKITLAGGQHGQGQSKMVAKRVSGTKRLARRK